jgi:hypothetical protein
MKSTDLYFDTLSAALDACETRLQVNGAAVRDDGWRAALAQPLSYGQLVQHSVELATFKGRATRKHFQISIQRLDRGNYELTTYFL